MTRSTPAARAYWWIALGVLDAMAAGGLPDATQAKMFAMRLGAQVKKLVEGIAEVSEQLLREALRQAAAAAHQARVLQRQQHQQQCAGAERPGQQVGPDQGRKIGGNGAHRGDIGLPAPRLTAARPASARPSRPSAAGVTLPRTTSRTTSRGTARRRQAALRAG